MHTLSLARTISTGLLTLTLLVPVVLAAQSAPASPNSELDAIRRATERFRDVEVARAEGYLEDPICSTAALDAMPGQLGGMGYHYFRPDLLGITGTEPRVDGDGVHTDFRKPSVLLYEPQPDGRLELVAVENLVFAKAWHTAGNTAPPRFMANDYYYRHDNSATGTDEAHEFEPHYELHIWLYRDNPSGMFMPYNPNVRCPAGSDHHAAMSSR